MEATESLKTYIGKKTVKAMPMNASDAKNAGANVPASYFDKNCSGYAPMADGYLVEYPDGYRSWSPVKAFEEAYSIAETYTDRMKIELNELNERICKATRAIYTFDAVSEEERWDMYRQLKAMREYADALYERLSRATAPNKRNHADCIFEDAPKADSLNRESLTLKECNNGSVV